MKNKTENIYKEALRIYAGNYVHDYVEENGSDAFYNGGEVFIATMYAQKLMNMELAADALGNQPVEIVRFLNKYYNIMFEIIHSHGGIIEGINNDEFLAIFGLKNKENHELSSVKACLECNKSIINLINEYPTLQINLNLNIGIVTGKLIMTSVGSKDRLFNVAIGADVNFSQRLMGANQHFGTLNLISEDTYEKIKNDYTCIKINNLKINGREGIFPVYNIIE